MKNFVIVPASEGPRREFKITWGLRAGYGSSGPIYDLHEAPCGMVDSLPVGMMLVAKALDEEMIYRAAAAFESGVDWKSLKAG